MEQSAPVPNEGAQGARRFLITLAVMSATVMQVLDTTIVNVALPHMEGQLAAAPDQISWVLTSYLVASGIFMPLTGYFTDTLGQKKYLLISILGFVVASVLSGLSTSLVEIVLFRLLQGMFGAALVPLSQSIMVHAFPPEERGRAMSIWGIGVMIGPILGPTLGGYLTDVLSWRWTFFINVPVGLLSLLLTWRVLPETPRTARSMDWTGLALMALAVGGLQLLLDRGNLDDWFNSHTIQIAAIASAFGFLGFVYHSIVQGERTLFHLRIFRDRNFSTASFLIAAFGLGLFGMLVLQPIMLESLYGYPAFTTGLVMAPRGLATMFSMFLAGALVNRLGARMLIGAGIAISALGTYFTTGYTLVVGRWDLIWPVAIQGLGLGLIFVPLSTVAYATLRPGDTAEAAGLFSLLRTIGSSIGISIATTVFTHQAQIAWNQIGSHIQPFNQALAGYLRGLHLSPSSPVASALLGSELGRQAQMLALVDTFQLITWSFIAMAPLILFLGGRNKARR